MYDLVEWAAEQPWSDGNVGMVGISYFAMTRWRPSLNVRPISRPSCRGGHL
jgi:uncharacterized protein